MPFSNWRKIFERFDGRLAGLRLSGKIEGAYAAAGLGQWSEHMTTSQVDSLFSSHFEYQIFCILRVIEGMLYSIVYIVTESYSMLCIICALCNVHSLHCANCLCGPGNLPRWCLLFWCKIQALLARWWRGNAWSGTTVVFRLTDSNHYCGAEHCASDQCSPSSTNLSILGTAETTTGHDSSLCFLG